MNDEMPPANLILQALHLIRAEGQKTNERLDKLTERVDGTNERLDKLTDRVDATNDRVDTLGERVDSTIGQLSAFRVVAMQALTDLNHKTDKNTEAINHLSARVENLSGEMHEVAQRFDHFLTGEGAKLVQRVDSLEGEVRRIAAKVDH